jgi:hypothetical protein
VTREPGNLILLHCTLASSHFLPQSCIVVLPCTDNTVRLRNTTASGRHRLMAEDIHIPSPSVFLRASPSPPRPRDDQPPVAKNARRQPSTTTKKAPVRKQSTAAAADGPPKPKQSKSRNGIFFSVPARLFNRVSSYTSIQRRASRTCTDRAILQAA